MSNKDLFIDSYLDYVMELFAKRDISLTRDEAFEIFSIAAIMEKSFEEVYSDIIVQGSQDGGIDGVCFTENDGYYIMDVFQCKNSPSLKQNELEKLKQDFDELFVKGNTSKLNTKDLLPKFEEYKSITQKKYRIESRLHFVFNGDKNSSTYTANKDLFNGYNRPSDNFFIRDSGYIDEKISDLIKSDSKRKEIKYTFEIESSNISPREPQAVISFQILDVKAVTCRINAIELCMLLEKEKEINNTEAKLFAENIRGFLGFKNKTNIKIRDTLNGEDSIFFPFLNNGITVLCDQMSIPTNPQVGKYILPTTNPVIVNGLQTTKVIYEIYQKDKSKLDGVTLLARFYEARKDDLIEKITEATNTQSPINLSDKTSTKNFQVYLKEIFKLKGINYISKRGDLFEPRKNDFSESVNSEKALKFWFATFYEKPETAKNSISKVLEEIFDATNDELNPLSQLFNGDQDSAVYGQIYIAYKIMKYVTDARKHNNSSDNDFIDYADELINYGIYKKISTDDKIFSENNISTSYSEIKEYVKSIANGEKKKKEEKKLTYSHNNYFKAPTCRVDLNNVCGFVEDDNLLQNLVAMRFDLGKI